MKDRVGKKLILGDKVAVTASRGYAWLEIGEVIGFTPKKVRVKIVHGVHSNDHETVLRDQSQVVVLEHNPAREAELAPKVPDANAVQDI